MIWLLLLLVAVVGWACLMEGSTNFKAQSRFEQAAQQADRRRKDY